MFILFSLLFHIYLLNQQNNIYQYLFVILTARFMIERNLFCSLFSVVACNKMFKLRKIRIPSIGWEQLAIPLWMFNVVFCNSISTDIKFSLFTWAMLASLLEHVCASERTSERVCVFAHFVCYVFIFKCDTTYSYQLFNWIVYRRTAAPSFWNTESKSTAPWFISSLNRKLIPQCTFNRIQ